MKYHLFIYSSIYDTGNMCIDIINRAIQTDDDYDWRGNNAAKYMRQFDYLSIKGEIERKIGSLCKVIISYPPKDTDIEHKAYLMIATSYEKAEEVLQCVHAVTTKNSLVLYDAETRRTFYNELIDKAFIAHRARAQFFRTLVRDKMQPVWRIHQLYGYEYENEHDKESAYIVELTQEQGVSFLSRVQRFYDCLKSGLDESETISCDNQCFTVSGKRYHITFCLEGYKKHGYAIGYMDGDMPKMTFLHRLGCAEAVKWTERCSELEKEDIRTRMSFLEMKEAYPNPADRYVKSVNITKWQRRQPFDLRYCGIGYYGSEVLFHFLPDDDYFKDKEHISVLAIEEESASFILPFIKDVYPLIYKRYYDENHLPVEMCKSIIESIKKAKKMIISDTYSNALLPYIEHFNLHVLAKRDGNNEDYWKTGDGKRIKENPVDFLFEHRYEVGRLYDVFTDWMETQIPLFDGDPRFLNIQGP